MIVWLTIGGAPMRQLYADASALPYLDNAAKRLQILLGADPLRSSVEGENASVTVLLRNDAGQASAEFSVPPLGVPAILYGVRGGVVEPLFEGLIESIDLDVSACRVGVSA